MTSVPTRTGIAVAAGLGAASIMAQRKDPNNGPEPSIAMPFVVGAIVGAVAWWATGKL